MTAVLRSVATALSPRLQRQVWNGAQPSVRGEPTLSSGYRALDALLPGYGWPLGALTELLIDHDGVGEMRLLAPVLRYLTSEARRHVVLIAPPHLPYAPAFELWGLALERIWWIQARPEQMAWATTQALKQGCVGAVLAWLAPTHKQQAIRRLQVAAQESSALMFLIRPLEAAGQSSPAPLRMICESVLPARVKTMSRRRWLEETTLSIDIFKRRGTPSAGPIQLKLPLQTRWLPKKEASLRPQGQMFDHVVDCHYFPALAAGSCIAGDGEAEPSIRTVETA